MYVPLCYIEHLLRTLTGPNRLSRRSSHQLNTQSARATAWEAIVTRHNVSKARTKKSLNGGQLLIRYDVHSNAQRGAEGVE